MNKQFKTYNELTEKKQRLKELLDAQKELIRADVEELKLLVKPASEIAARIKKFTTRDKVNLILAISSDAIARHIFKMIILARSGRLGKLIVPYFIKNFSSDFLREQKQRIFETIKSWFKPKEDEEHQKEAS